MSPPPPLLLVFPMSTIVGLTRPVEVEPLVGALGNTSPTLKLLNGLKVLAGSCLWKPKYQTPKLVTGQQHRSSAATAPRPRISGIFDFFGGAPSSRERGRF